VSDAFPTDAEAGRDPSTDVAAVDEPSTEDGAAGEPATDVAAPDEPVSDAAVVPQGNRRLVLVTFSVAAAVVLLDQVTKFLAVRYLEGQPPVDVIGTWVRLLFLRNSGAAFSIGTGVTFIFSAIAVAVIVVIVRTSRKLGSLGWALALGGLLGGAVGNLLDRIFRDPGFLQGHVVDFIAVPNFAVFNLADASIVCSAVLMVLLSLRGIEISGTRA
jgi:signal peptidase II